MEKQPIKKYKAILEKGGRNYRDEDVVAIMEFLSLIAELDYEIYSQQQQRERYFKNLEQTQQSEEL